MDESHRLKPMVENFDKKLFNELYAKTKQLKEKLVYQIDPRRFGVDSDEVRSWFDVKFVYTFNKYYNTDRERLLGYIIASLQMYKQRIVKSAYLQKNQIHQTIDITELFNYEDLLLEEDTQNEDSILWNKAMSYFHKYLSDDALLVLEIETNPPPFIIDSIKGKSDKLTKIPSHIIADYLDIPEEVEYIDNLRREIRKGIRKAKEHFSQGLN